MDRLLLLFFCFVCCLLFFTAVCCSMYRSCLGVSAVRVSRCLTAGYPSSVTVPSAMSNDPPVSLRNFPTAYLFHLFLCSWRCCFVLSFSIGLLSLDLRCVRGCVHKLQQLMSSRSSESPVGVSVLTKLPSSASVCGHRHSETYAILESVIGETLSRPAVTWCRSRGEIDSG